MRSLNSSNGYPLEATKSKRTWSLQLPRKRLSRNSPLGVRILSLLICFPESSLGSGGRVCSSDRRMACKAKVEGSMIKVKTAELFRFQKVKCKKKKIIDTYEYHQKQAKQGKLNVYSKFLSSFFLPPPSLHPPSCLFGQPGSICCDNTPRLYLHTIMQLYFIRVYNSSSLAASGVGWAG